MVVPRNGDQPCPTVNDEVVVRIYGDTPSNVVSAATNETDGENIFMLNTTVNLGPLAVIGFFETTTSLGQLAAGEYTALALVNYTAQGADGECQYLSGCGWEVDGVDYSEYGFESFDECNYLCDCPEGWVYCFVDPCLVETCPAYPDAECVADYCGGCFADFYVDGELVECNMQFGCTDPQANNYDPDAV